MLKRLGILVLVVVIAILMAMLTQSNSGTVDIDLFVMQGTYPITVVLAVTFVIGMGFGMLCMTGFVFRMIQERRTLRRSLQMSESEVSSLRNLPLDDAN